MSQITFPDMLDEFYKVINQDATIQAIKGLKVEKIVDRKALASTETPGNKRIILSNQRSGNFEWNCGGQAGQQRVYIKIETIVKTLETANENAQEIMETIRKRIREILFDATFSGTGWLYHKEVDDKYPSAPMKSRAYHIFVYEVLTSQGR